MRLRKFIAMAAFFTPTIGYAAPAASAVPSASAKTTQTTLAAGKARKPISSVSTQAEIAFWQSVNQTDPAELRAYLTKYPEGTFAPLARAKLHDLAAAPASANKTNAATAQGPQSSTNSKPEQTSYVPGWQVQIHALHIQQYGQRVTIDPAALAMVAMPGPTFTLGKLYRASGTSPENDIASGGSAKLVVRSSGTYGLGLRLKSVYSNCKANLRIEGRPLVAPVQKAFGGIDSSSYSGSVPLKPGLYDVTWTYECIWNANWRYANFQHPQGRPTDSSITILVAPPGGALSPSTPGAFVRVRSAAAAPSSTPALAPSRPLPSSSNETSQSPAGVTAHSADSDASESASTASGPRITMYTDTALNVRDRPSTSGNVIATLSRGKGVMVIANKGRWATVQLRGTKGYVSSRYLSDIKPPAIEPVSSASHATYAAPGNPCPTGEVQLHLVNGPTVCAKP